MLIISLYPTHPPKGGRMIRLLQLARAVRASVTVPAGGSWNGGIEEDQVDDASDSLLDADVLRAGTADGRKRWAA